MNQERFDFMLLSADDLKMVREQYLPTLRQPDLVITSEEKGPYLYRWYQQGARNVGAVYLHIQTSSDPERPLHDHPWPNQTVNKAGGCIELYQDNPPYGRVMTRVIRPGMTVHRPARQAHRLMLAPGQPYSISQFSVGFNERPWGFWIGPGWFSHEQCTKFVDGKGSVFVWPPGTEKYRDGREPVLDDEHGRMQGVTEEWR